MPRKNCMRNSLLLFLCATILIQIFYAIETNTNLFQTNQYFPGGFTVNVIYYLSLLAVLFLFLGKISFAPVGLKRAAGLKRYVLVGLVLALIGFGLRVLFIPGTFGSSIYPVLYYVLGSSFHFSRLPHWLG